MDRTKAAFLPLGLAVDVTVIDEQHAELFALLADLKRVCLERNEVPAAELDALINFLHDHFETEERLAREAAMNFSSHARKHQTVLKGIQRIADHVRNGEADVYSLIKYIEYWFEKHIVDEDKALAYNIQQSSFTAFGEQFA